MWPITCLVKAEHPGFLRPRAQVGWWPNAISAERKPLGCSWMLTAQSSCPRTPS